MADIKEFRTQFRVFISCIFHTCYIRVQHIDIWYETKYQYLKNTTYSQTIGAYSQKKATYNCIHIQLYIQILREIQPDTYVSIYSHIFRFQQKYLYMVTMVSSTIYSHVDIRILLRSKQATFTYKIVHLAKYHATEQTVHNKFSIK